MDMLQELFSSRNRSQIIALLVTRPKERFYLREIARLVKGDPKAVKLELDRLERLGLVKSVSSGNRRYLEVNTEFSLYPELKGLVLKTSGLGEILREALKELPTIQFAFIYGSVAKGEETPGSDLDLFVVGQISGPLLHKMLSKVKVSLNREINTARMTLEELRQKLGRRDSFVADVIKGKKVFIIGTERELKRTISAGTA
ncbi:MAG: nucleotidyltransferase domain-containing protein [Elusimicrobia bacterium]|nr:nucleotidyltransferase domain-containing protein [Elusimicrobiota bacterium]